MNVDKSFLLEAFPLVSCPNLTSLLCSFHPTTDYSAPPWFHLPCVYWLRCSPFARFDKSEGFGSYGSLVRFDSVRLWASLLLSLLPLNGFFFLTISLWWHPWSVAIFFLPRVHCWTCLCTYAVMCVILPSFQPFLNTGQSDFAGLCQEENLKVSRSPVASTFVKEWSLVQKEEQRQKLVIGWRCLRAFKELSDGRKQDYLGWTSAWTLFCWCFEGTQALLILWGVFFSSWDRAVRNSDCAKGSRSVYLCYHFKGYNKRKCRKKVWKLSSTVLYVQSNSTILVAQRNTEISTALTHFLQAGTGRLIYD